MLSPAEPLGIKGYPENSSKWTKAVENELFKHRITSIILFMHASVATKVMPSYCRKKLRRSVNIRFM